ncbi:DUF4234 domain-containing protein [Blastococcus deserti]|uniref:DUF4234 domain-containing protein n=1 Tax=Blastococcus deserti TaxID=2259033 RepID=A0ABW4XGG9_9ACTN
MTTTGNYSAPQQDPTRGQPYGPPYGQVQPPYGVPQPQGFQPMPGAPAYAQHARPTGPIGKVRGTGVAILLCVVTFGIYSLYYYFANHEEMKRHSGEGIGGVLGLVLALFVGVASPFLLSHEVGGLYERRGQARPVSGLTGLWVIPGFLLLVGPIVWFVKTNGALNAYWRSLGAR